jgi:hypothetical protein
MRQESNNTRTRGQRAVIFLSVEVKNIDVGTLSAPFFLFQMASYVFVLFFVWFFWRWSICKYACAHNMDA